MRIYIFILALVLFGLAGLDANAQTRGQQVDFHRDLSASLNLWQFVDRITRPCASGSTSAASVIANPNNTGNVTVTTCTGGNLTVNGVIITPGGGGFGNVVGTPPTTTNAVARYTDATGLLIKNSSWIIDNSGNATTPGGLTTGNAGGVTGSITLSGSTSGSVTISTNATSTTTNFNSATLTPTVNAGADLGTTALGFKQIFLDATITAGGTTGAQTINKAAGSVNFAAAATSLVVTSNKVTASSIVLCTVATNDTTLKDVQCVPTAGSFTMFANAAATAETRVNFWVLNQ